MDTHPSAPETNEDRLTTSSCLLTSDSSQEFQEIGTLVKSTSTASTVSFSASPVRSVSLDVHSSQDSGICLSQDNFTDFSQEFSMEDAQTSSSSSRSSPPAEKAKAPEEATSESAASTSRQSCTDDVEATKSSVESGVNRKRPLSDESHPSTSEDSNSSPSSKGEEVEVEVEVEVGTETPRFSSGRKRKSSSTATTVDCKPPKCAKVETTLSTSSEDDSEEGGEGTEEQGKSFLEFLQSSSGKEWLNSHDSRPFLTSAPAKKALMEAIVANMCSGSSSGTDAQDPPSGLSIMCSICFLRPKNASIIHGRLSHQATCYQCARRLLDSGSRCPVCRRKIHMVCKHIIT